MIKFRCAGILVFSVCFCFNSLSCSSKVQLHLDSQSQLSSPVENVAKLNCAGISVIVETGVWYGRENDGKEIVPVRITFSNNSGFPIIIRYSDFFIAGLKSGNVYPALPPYYFENDDGVRKTILPEIVASEPYFDCEKFNVAYYSAGMYPSLPIWKGVFLHDQLYYNLYYPLWAGKKLESYTSLIMSEIPEGVLLDGGFLSGFIYFQTLSKKEKKVSLQFRICEARRGKVLETISIPFVVKD